MVLQQPFADTVKIVIDFSFTVQEDVIGPNHIYLNYLRH